MTRDSYASLKLGLVGCWIPSVSGSGLLLPDLSGRGNNGALTNMDASDWVSSGSGMALDFDGVNDYVDAGDCCDFTSGFMTISAWIKRNETTTAARTVVSKFDRSGGVSTEDGILFQIFSNTISYAAVLDGATHRFLATVADLNVTDWVHIAARVQSNNGSAAALYKNGLQVAGSWVTLTGNVTLDNNAYSLRLGNYRYSAVNYDHFSGLIDDVRIYNRALTESEIKLLASKRGIGLQPSPTRFIAREKKTGLRRKILTGLP